MNFNEAMQMLGTKLQGKYGHLGFKYKKSDKTLTRHSKNFTYMIAFSSFGGNTKDITDEEYLAQLETKREEITHEILERCRTKRKNLYITGPVALNVAQKFSVHRLCDKEGKHNLANRFVGELMEQLVQDGLLVTTKTRNGPGVRTATDAEISSPLPGQQQMTL